MDFSPRGVFYYFLTRTFIQKECTHFMDNKNNQLGNFLKDKRTAAGLSQADVAKELGYTTSQFISNWERGLSTPPIEVLKVLADMYEVNPDSMFKAVLESAINRVTLNLKRKFYGRKAV